MKLLYVETGTKEIGATSPERDTEIAENAISAKLFYQVLNG